MFTVDYDAFINDSFYSDFSISYMPGMTIRQIISSKSKVIVNIDAKLAYVYID